MMIPTQNWSIFLAGIVTLVSAQEIHHQAQSQDIGVTTTQDLTAIKTPSDFSASDFSLPQNHQSHQQLNLLPARYHMSEYDLVYAPEYSEFSDTNVNEAIPPAPTHFEDIVTPSHDISNRGVNPQYFMLKLDDFDEISPASHFNH